MSSDGVVTGWTGRAAVLFGWTAGEALGRTLSSLIVPERMRQQHETGLHRYLATGEGPILNTRIEIAALHKDGYEFPVQLSVTPIRRGDRVSFSAFIEDITERKRMEEEVRQLQKLEAIGRLSGGIAHDFNNILGVIVAVGNTLLPELSDPDQRHQLEEIVRAGERGASLTRQFLAFSRKQILQPEVLDLNLVVQELEPMLRRLIRADIVLLATPAPGLWPVQADRSQIEQVVLNLVVNARDAMPPPAGGTLQIETANATLPRDLADEPVGVVPGEYVMLAVSDSGHGMDAATRKRLFEPFFTTKEVGKGTGLGLATIYGIVKQSGGHIAVVSALGQGASFKVFLPRAAEPVTPRSRDAGEPGAAPPIADLHVLLVDDEPALRRAVERMLVRLRYRVTVAPGSAEALDLITREGLQPDVLLTDLVMPGMGGEQLAQRVRELLPGIRVLPMSGYIGEATTQSALLRPGAPFVQKPFTSEELAAALQQLMRGGTF